MLLHVSDMTTRSDRNARTNSAYWNTIKTLLNRDHLSSERAKIGVRRKMRPTNILIEYLDVPADVFRKGDV